MGYGGGENGLLGARVMVARVGTASNRSWL